MNYTKIEKAKDGSKIPYSNERAFHSKYSPKNEAQRIANEILDGRFFVVLGLAGGYHISAILSRFPNAKIVVAELTKEDAEFLKKIDEVSKLFSDERVKIAAICDLKNELKNSYRPALHGNLTIVPLRSWCSAFPDANKAAHEKIEDALKDIKADFSVQSHFGKIWQKNIFLNLKNAEKCGTAKDFFDSIPKEKTAAIIAAGPSLDESIKKIKENRSEYFVIATDTAFGTLMKSKIEPDLVASVDGQAVSRTHFMHKSAKSAFAFDLCANASSVRRVLQNGAKTVFFETGHPLARYANAFSQGCFPILSAGSGTVTVAAANIAIEAGFSKIEFFGADFGYFKKPYARGTYLDSQFSLDETRLKPKETAFNALMFRTELFEAEKGKKTTEILKSYENSLKNMMISFGFKEYSSDSTLIFQTKSSYSNIKSDKKFVFNDFKTFYKEKLKKMNLTEESRELFTILPLISWAEAQKANAPAIIAHDKTLRYTEKL